MIKRLTWPAIAFVPFLIFLSQAPLTKLKLNAVGCGRVLVEELSRSCNSRNCNVSFSLSAFERYLVLGHVLQTHRVLVTGHEIQPISSVRTNVGESWPELFVYDLGPARAVELVAIYPATAKLNGFVGLEPRSCSSAEAITVPSISPVLTMAAQALILVLLLLSWMSSGLASDRQRPTWIWQSRAFPAAVFVVFLGSFSFGSHIFDAIHPDYLTRRMVLRVLALSGYILPMIGTLPARRSITYPLLALLAVALPLAVLYGRTAIVGVPIYAASVTFCATVSTIALIIRRERLLALLVAVTLLDGARMLGYRISDFPPIYWNIVVIGVFGLITNWKRGAKEVLPFLGHAYETVSRDLQTLKLRSSLNALKSPDDFSSIVQMLPGMTGCNRAAIALFLPGKAAKTYTYDALTGVSRAYDDGSIKGALFTRVLLYQEPLWFRTIDDLKAEGFNKVQHSEELRNSLYFCALPILCDGQIVGAIALTKFHDKHIESDRSYQAELQNKISVTVERIEAYLQQNMFRQVKQREAYAQSVRSAIDKVAVESRKKTEFIRGISKALADQVSGSVLVFHRTSSDSAVLTEYIGLSPDQAAKWVERPLNVSVGSGNRIGPFIVAFNEGKPSYVRTVDEIFPQLHPYSVELFKMIRAKSLLTLPVIAGGEQFVFGVISHDEKVIDPAWFQALKDITPHIAANLRAVLQTTSVESLGRLATRLIGDDELRSEILERSLDDRLPSTIGAERESLLVFVDIVNSSMISDESSTMRAESIGRFYDEVQSAGFELLQAYPRKAMGDGILLSADIANKTGKEPLVTAIAHFTEMANAAAIRAKGAGARVCLHYGNHFCGMLGTRSFAQIDVMGTEVDRVCKLEAVVKTWKQYGVVGQIGATETVILQLFGNKAELPKPTGSDPFVRDYYIFENTTDFVNLDTVRPLKKVA